MAEQERYHQKVLDKIQLDITGISQKTGLSWIEAYTKLKEIMRQENPFCRRYACYHCLKTIDDKIIRFTFPDEVNIYFGEKRPDELLSASPKPV